MGQFLNRVHEIEKAKKKGDQGLSVVPRFPDLQNLPPEISLTILSHLNATDLCLAACVWDNLANDEVLWMGLCKNSWGYASIYKYITTSHKFSYKKLYMLLDEATLTFNGNAFEVSICRIRSLSNIPQKVYLSFWVKYKFEQWKLLGRPQGERYLIEKGLLEDNPLEIAKFLHFTKRIKADIKREYLDGRRDVLDHLLQLQNFQNQFLPNALRKLFDSISAPKERGDLLSDLIEKFSLRFCSCNPKLGLDKDTVFVLCFSLIMLSVDLCSPHVKNKMSKREFIKNTRRAVTQLDDDLAGDLYDNIYLIGHVASDNDC